jgi:spore coat protein A
MLMISPWGCRDNLLNDISDREHNITRRKFLVGGGLATAAARFGAAQMVHLPPMKPAPPLIDPARMMPFVDPLPLPQVAKPMGTRPGSSPKSQVPFYRIPAQEFYSKVHRDVPPTRFWGFGNSMPGPTVEARSGEEILIEMAEPAAREAFSSDRSQSYGRGKRPSGVEAQT